jgi:hypothetical protein
MHQRRPAVPGGMLLLVVASCAILAGGCGRQTGGSEPSGASRAAGQPHTTTVTLRDAGRTVTLQVGDRLDVALGTASQTSDAWRLITYPQSLLSLLPAPAGHHRFTAYAPGRGTLTANPTPVCAPTDNPNPMLCPPKDAAARDSPQRRPRTRFSLTIHVTR